MYTNQSYDALIKRLTTGKTTTPSVNASNDTQMVEECLRPQALVKQAIKRNSKAELIAVKKDYKKALKTNINALKNAQNSIAKVIFRSNTPRWGGSRVSLTKIG